MEDSDLPLGHADSEDLDAGGFDCDRCGAYIPDTAAEQFAITTDDGIVCLRCKRQLDRGFPWGLNTMIQQMINTALDNSVMNGYADEALGTDPEQLAIELGTDDADLEGSDPAVLVPLILAWRVAYYGKSGHEE